MLLQVFLLHFGEANVDIVNLDRDVRWVLN